MRLRTLIFAAILITGARSAFAADNAVLLVRSPTVNRTHVVFVYGGYLWSVPRNGGDARQLTTAGHEGLPIFSPDGNWIAFTGEYDGNVDVFIMPAEGGEPRRLTFHPGADVAVGWTPNGQRVLFRSSRQADAAFARLSTVPVNGGWPAALPMWRGEGGAYPPAAA